jgi:hypothetical protein
MAKSSKGKAHTVSIIIQWHEEDADMTDSTPSDSESKVRALSQSLSEGAAYEEGQHSTQDIAAQRSSKRLLPTDRVVLDALRARISDGEKVTTLVRTRELETECGISRRQVQICLKRLSEKGFIKRLLVDRSPGSTDGYRYQLSTDVPRG